MADNKSDERRTRSSAEGDAEVNDKTIRGAALSSDTGPPAMPSSGPPAMPEDSSVMSTQRGDSRHDSKGNVLAPPSIPPARYVLGAEIARGGMGRVVEATDTLLGRVVALKEALSTDAEALERFARETRITARLEHPSIVPVHDGGKGPNGMPYYVMRKIEGRPLERLVAESKGLGDRLRLIRHMVASAEAIAHAHERGIVHRDIKPSNILVGELGETIVIDWGLAKVIGETDEPTEILGVALQPVVDGDTIKTRAGIVFGTPGFMAPEQLRGGPVDPRWDVYALGATLYHLLSKKPPHHAKTANEMMQAAVNAPPTPVSELVQGVPPELATIVDKALAFDPEKRYQDARELAEDLQRFLGGQLVASHHYSTREKISRYVMQHRYAFIVGAVAAAALMIGGAIAFVRIVNERNRADHNAVEARRAQKVAEEEKLVAERRTEDLSLSSARSVASTNPTFAIALVKPLVEKRWREVRAIAAEARAAGVAWSLPASTGTHSLQLSRDGRKLLAAGEDGVVRLVDLDTRTQKTIVEAGSPVTAKFVDDEKKVLLWIGTRISVIDLGGGARRDIEIDIPIVSLDVIATTAYWVDAKDALWQMELSAVAPRQIPLDESVGLLAASPDGRWIALAGIDHLMLYDRTKPTEAPIQVLNGTLHAMDWAKDGSRLAVLHDDQAVEVAMEPIPYVVHRLTVGERSHVVESNKRLFTIGPTGVGMLSASLSRPRKQLSKPIGLEESRDDAIVAGGEDQLVVLTDHGDHVLAAPSGHFSMLRASPASPYIVAIADDRLLVWNLDEIEPRVVGTQIATAKFVTGDDLVATTLDGPAQWIDLATGTRRELGQWPAILDVVVSPSGRFACAIDMAHQAHVIEAGKPAVAIAGSVDRAGFVNDGQIVLATDAGVVDLYDVAAAKRTKIHAHDAPLASLAWNMGSTGNAWVAAHYADGIVWRQNVTSADKGTTIASPRSPSSNVRVVANGDVFLALGEELLRWPAGAKDLAHHAKLPLKITTLGAIGTDYLLAFTDGGAAYLVDVTKPDTIVDLEDTLGRTNASMSATTGLVAVLNRGAIDVLDPLVRPPRWHLASGATYADVQVSNDGRRILAKTGSTLLVWDLVLPANAAETGAWLDKMTNAIPGSGAKSLGWR